VARGTNIGPQRRAKSAAVVTARGREEGGEGEHDQPRGGGEATRPAPHGGGAPTPPPHEQRERHELGHDQVGDEPEVLPVDAGRGPHVVHEVAVKGSERLAGGGDAVQVDLRRNDHEHAEGERHAQPARPLREVGARAAPLERRRGGDAGDEEEQRHPPLGEEVAELADQPTRLRVLDEPGARAEHERGVIREERRDREHAEPVELRTPLGGRGSRRVCDVRRAGVGELLHTTKNANPARARLQRFFPPGRRRLPLPHRLPILRV
jgi:hypothetical protein